MHKDRVSIGGNSTALALRETVKDALVAEFAGGEGRDLIELVKEDHTQAKSLLEQFDRLRSDSSEMESLSPPPRQDLAAHEVAEEEMLYPALRGLGRRRCRALADARIEEQQPVEERLAVTGTDGDRLAGVPPCLRAAEGRCAA